ncbi:MAG TPA: nucleotidyltransferase family protein [Candidatus Binatia bacterium]|nr:nucleotidyltransferase family protein [Candidatus Binatia bacterium]
MQAVLLAAGRGTRMGALTATCPKPLLTVAERPIIEHIIAGFADAGVREFVIVTGYRGAQIEAALADGARLGVHIVYRQQEHALGTARALLLARDVIAPVPFALSWGDILVQPDLYPTLVARFHARPCDALLALNDTDDPRAGAAVYVERDRRVTRIVEKPPPGTSTTRWNNAGVFVFDPIIFDYAARVQPSPRGEYELPQAIAAMVSDGRPVFSVPIDGYWSDVGTPEDLHRARRDFPARNASAADSVLV